ncbi:MAG: caspase family protein, partial [Myxococcota bacterium]|nr:caspase family protein [Myxococcota bacterium]
YELKVDESESGASLGAPPASSASPLVVPGAPTPPAATAAPAATSGAITRTGALGPGDRTLQSGEYMDALSFVWNAGQRVRLRLRSDQFDPYLIVRAPAGAQRDNDDLSNTDRNAGMDYEVAETGAHQVLVTSYRPGESGAWTLTIEPLDGAPAPTTPGTVTPSPGPPSAGGAPSPMAGAVQIIRGELGPGDATLQSGEYVDTYTMRWPAGRLVSLEARSSAFDTYLIVRPPSGPQQDNDDGPSGGTDAALSFLTSVEGDYRIAVTSFRPGEMGPYELVVHGGWDPSGMPDSTLPGQPGSTPAPAHPVPAQPPPLPGTPAPGVGEGAGTQTIRGTLGPGDATLPSGEYVDTHEVTVNAGEQLAIRLSSRQFDAYLLLRSPSGHPDQNDDYQRGSTDAGIDVAVAEAGRYQIGVTSYRPGERGEYVLTVTRGASAVPRPSGDAAAAGGRLWGLFAGITDYGPRRERDLPECANDAIKLAEALRGAGLLSESRQIVLTDGQATVAGVRDGMQRLAAQMGPQDVFIFFFSGHGGRREPGSADPREIDGRDEYLVLSDADLDDDELGRWLDGLRVGTSIVALDACFSGGFAKDVVTRPGRIGLFSSEEDVTSAVAHQFQAGGYLSHWLRLAVRGEADTEPRDGVLTAGELAHYLYAQFGMHVRDVHMAARFQHLVVDRGAVPVDRVLWAYR